MDRTLNPPHARAARTASPVLGRLIRVFSLVRYRFFLYAGLLPYLLGAAFAYRATGHFAAALFWSGLLGIILAVIGVEAFNEYFDDRMGTDRVFNPQDIPPMSDLVLWTGVAGFAGAFGFGIYLALHAGWPVLVFAALGGMAAVFYVAPPIRWAYRGLGETMIALSYGPWMVLGSLYLLAHRLTGTAFAASLVPGLLIMALAVVNAIPDFHQDRLVGKRNLVVRLGRQRGVFLYLGLASTGLLIVPLGVVLGWFPPASLAALLALPWLVASARAARTTYNTPRLFIPAIRAIVTCYAVAVGLFTLAIALTAIIQVLMGNGA
ncbi:prenyltransferase [Acidiphilium sp.]|uniref:prenyltransferase n=1 Tax=Acidiphilium sp. TaxID=527 RepID=UPI003D02AF50